MVSILSFFSKKHSKLLLSILSISAYLLPVLFQSFMTVNPFFYILNMLFFGCCICFVLYTNRDELFQLSVLKKYMWLVLLIFGFQLAFISPALGYLLANVLDASLLENQQSVVSLMNHAPFVLWLLMTVVFAPIIEEVLYRHLLIGNGKGSAFFGRWLLSYVLFVLMHCVNFSITELVVYGLSSLALMVCYALTRSLECNIVLHMLLNAVAFVSIF